MKLMLYPRAMKPYSANGNPNAKEVKLPPTPKNVHVPHPDDGKINELGTILLTLVVFYVAPDVIRFVLDPSKTNIFRFLLGCLLGYLVLKGNNKARWWMVTFSGLSAILPLLTGIAIIFLTPIGIFLFVLGLISLGIAIALVVPPLSKHFEG
jgi:hypothetical protein